MYDRTFYYILLHSSTFYYKTFLVPESYYKKTWHATLRHDYCYVFNRLLQKRQRLDSKFECGYPKFLYLIFGLWRSNPEIMIRLSPFLKDDTVVTCAKLLLNAGCPRPDRARGFQDSTSAEVEYQNTFVSGQCAK